MRTHQPLLASLVLGVGGLAGGEQTPRTCPGAFDFQGIGSVSLVPTGWATPGNMTYPHVRDGAISSTLNSRAYFASTCTPGVYDNSQYLALDLRGKTLTYTTDLSRAGCGCNAALYLTSMRQNKRSSECSDYYCDANNVCGESCAEIDIQEANLFSWHSTLHTSQDHAGLGKGYGGGGRGWSGPRDFGAEEFGPSGRCVNTTLPFQVSVYFRMDDRQKLQAMEITLSQHGRDCPLWISVAGYSGVWELDAALAAGMTPIVSYWGSDDLQWMDGKGADDKGPCSADVPKDCGEAVRFYDFHVTPPFPSTTPPPEPSPRHFSFLPADAKVGAFVAGALMTLLAEVLVLLVWMATSMHTAHGQAILDEFGDCDSPGMKPLRRAIQGSSQNLLALVVESGDGSPAAEAPPARQPPMAFAL